MTDDHKRPALVADVGGTNIRLATVAGSSFLNQTTRLCADFETLTDALEVYIDESFGGSSPDEAAIAVAGPVTGDLVDITNQRWSFSIEQLRTDLELSRLVVVNDFTAQAAAVPVLDPRDYSPLKSGQTVERTAIAVLGPGTGLGVSGLVHSAHGWIPLSGEGGHTTLGATNAREWQILEALLQRFGRVSNERALSGPGLVNLYRALLQIDGELQTAPTPAEIVQLAGEDPEGHAGQAVRLFSGWLGAAAGDLALTLGAWSGVYLCGGILPKMGERFDRDHFVERFQDKGRYRDIMECIPVFLVTNTEIAHLGLAELLRQG